MFRSERITELKQINHKKKKNKKTISKEQLNNILSTQRNIDISKFENETNENKENNNICCKKSCNDGLLHLLKYYCSNKLFYNITKNFTNKFILKNHIYPKNLNQLKKLTKFSPITFLLFKILN